MVKFAYTVAVLQTQRAVARLDLADPVCERDLVQRACLPFLRRAALLVCLHFPFIVVVVIGED